MWRGKIKSDMQVENKEKILKCRKEIERELVKTLKETKSGFKLQDVQKAVFYEEDNDDMTKIIAMFDRGGDISELENILELVSDAWNYFPHKALDGISPAEKILAYEKEEKKTKGKTAIKPQKLTEKQFDLLWSSGGKGPYSQANLIKQVRILDNSVSRIFIVVETEINPTTFEIVEKNRCDDEFKNDIMIQQLLDRAEYRGPQLGYIVSAFEEEYRNDDVLLRAEDALKYTQESIIKMHGYVMRKYLNY